MERQKIVPSVPDFNEQLAKELKDIQALKLEIKAAPLFHTQYPPDQRKRLMNGEWMARCHCWLRKLEFTNYIFKQAVSELKPRDGLLMVQKVEARRVRFGAPHQADVRAGVPLRRRAGLGAARCGCRSARPAHHHPQDQSRGDYRAE